METNMYLLLGILALLILIFLTIFAFAIYSGLFLDVTVKSCKPPFESLAIAYKFARGPYKESSELFTEAHSIAPDLNCIGVYYDDPRKVSGDGLRYVVGVIVNDGKMTADEGTREKLLSEGYKFTTFPTVDYVVMTSFPFKGTLSVMIAIAKVYPMMADYIKEHKLCAHPFIEIYQEQSILFLAPLAKQDEFYVEESTAAVESGGESEFTTHDDRTSEDDDEDNSMMERNKLTSKKKNLDEENEPKEKTENDLTKKSDKANLSESESVDSTIEVLRVEREPVVEDISKLVTIDHQEKNVPAPPPTTTTKNNSDKSSSSSFEELHLETS